jgi:hypothetical protein
VLDDAEYVDFIMGSGAWFVSTSKADAETGIDASRTADELLGRVISECAAVIAPPPPAITKYCTLLRGVFDEARIPKIGITINRQSP